MIMVMLGGLTMWIDPKSVPARVSMGKYLNNLGWYTLVQFCKTPEYN